MKTLKNLFGSALLPLFVLFSCSEDDQVARLRITLVDSPANYDEVNVDIQGVSVHVSEQEGEDDGGWIEFEDSDVGVINLLDYTDFPAGKISQIRLLLGENNSVIVDDMEEPLITPSGQESGLKLQVHETLQGGVTYNFKLDFEAAQSVVHNGNDEYLLKPVIKVITETISGAIKGSVEPADINVAVYVMADTEVISTTYAPEGSSEFLAPGIPEGQYTVTFDPGESDYDVKSIENVEVTIGEVTDIGTVQLDEKQQ